MRDGPQTSIGRQDADELMEKRHASVVAPLAPSEKTETAYKLFIAQLLRPNARQKPSRYRL